MRCRCGVWRVAARHLPRTVTTSGECDTLCATAGHFTIATQHPSRPLIVASPGDGAPPAMPAPQCYQHLSAAEEAWYVRQTRAGVLCASDLPHIFAGPSAAERESGRDATLALALLLARQGEAGLAGVLPFLFSRPVSEQLETICRIAEEERATAGQLVSLAEALLTHLVETDTAMGSSSCCSGRPIPASFLIRLVRGLDRLPLAAAPLRRVVHDALALAPHTVAPYMRYETFLYDLLAVAVRRMPWSELAALLAAAGMPYEACAYRCNANNRRDKDILFAPPCDDAATALAAGRCTSRSAGGGGGVAAELLAVTRRARRVADFPAATLRCLTAAMPPRLRDYTLDLIVLSWLRRMQEVAPCGPADHLSTGSALDVVGGQRRSVLEWASRVHFVLGEGSRATATLLLPQCQTRRQLFTTMQHTRDAGAALALRALQHLLSLSAKEEAYVTLRAWRPAAATARATPISPRRGSGRRRRATASRVTLLCRIERTALPSQQTLPWLDALLAPHDTTRGCLTWRPAQVSAAFERALRLIGVDGASVCQSSAAAADAHVEATLTRVPAQRVDHVVAAMPQLTSDMMSWWLLLELRAGRVSVVLHLLHLAARRRVVPEGRVLLALLDTAVARVFDRGESAGAMEDLCALVHILLTGYAVAARTICRVAVERAARIATTQPTLSCGDATRLCLAVALLAASHAAGTQAAALLALCRFAPRTATGGSSIAAAPDPVAAALRRTIDGVLCDGAEKGLCKATCEATEGVQGAVPLHHDVLLALHRAMAALTRRPVELDVFVRSVGRRSVAWWGAHGMAKWLPATRRLLHLGLVELWPLALDEVRWSVARASASEQPSLTVHQALWLTALGAPRSDVVLSAIRALQHRLTSLPPREERATGGAACEACGGVGRRRMQGVWDARLVYTLACAAEAMRARADGQAVLRLLPPHVRDLPPLLRLVRLRAMREEGEFAELAMLTLPQELQAVQDELVQKAADRTAAQVRRRYGSRRRTGKSCRHTATIPAEEETLLDAAFASCPPLHSLLLARQYM